jgi:hypothetical protein
VSRRKFREEKSKFTGTKQVLQDLNQAAHQIVHDSDVALPAGAGATGYVLVWSTGTVIRAGVDQSAEIFAPGAGSIALVYASLPFDATELFEVDVLLNGSTIFTTGAHRPKVQVATRVSPDAVPDITALVARDALEVQVLSGSANPGRGMVYIVVV